MPLELGTLKTNSALVRVRLKDVRICFWNDTVWWKDYQNSKE